MNNNYASLLAYLTGSGNRTGQTAQQILQGTGLQGTYNTQVALGNAATQAQQGVVNNAVNGQPGGSYVNAAPMQDTANQNMIKDSSMPVNLLLGIINQASAQAQNQNSNATSAFNTGVSTGPNNLNAQVNAANSGWNVDSNGNITNNGTGTGATSGNPRIDTYVNAIMNGYKSIADIPSDIAPRVMQQLQKNGYDAAKPINTDISALTDLYGIGGNPISQGNNPGQTVKNDFGELMNFLTGGTYQTQAEQQVKNYVEASNNFKSKYANILGKNIDLPTVNDTPETAKGKFSKLMKQVQAVYYNGGQGPTSRPSLNSFNQ